MSEELKDIELKDTQKETKKTSRKKQQNVEIEAVEEITATEAVEETKDVEVVEDTTTKVVEDTKVSEDEVVKDEPKSVEPQASTKNEKTQVFDIKKIKREAVKYNHVVFTYSDGFICHAKSKHNADILHKEYLKK